jgi:hypothetical protein
MRGEKARGERKSIKSHEHEEFDSLDPILRLAGNSTIKEERESRHFPKEHSADPQGGPSP